MSYSQMKTRIMNKVDFLPALNNKCVSNGRVNAYNVIYDTAAPPDGTPDIHTCLPYTWKSVGLGWHDNSSNEIGFNIQRKKSGESTFSSVTSVDENVAFYVDTSLNGGTMDFKVKVYNMAGNATSNTVNVTIPSGAPAAPSDLATEGPTLVHHVILNWQDNATNEQTFVIQRRPSGGGQWTNVGTINPFLYAQYPAMSYTDTQVNQGNYYYRIKATNPNGYSYSNQIYVEVEAI
jgi:hypothetical protein